MILNNLCFKAQRHRWLLSFVVELLYRFLVFGSGLPSCLGLGKTIVPTYSYNPHLHTCMHAHTYTHTQTQAQTHTWKYLVFTLQANQAAYSVITTNPAASSDLTPARVQSSMLIAVTGNLAQQFFH